MQPTALCSNTLGIKLTALFSQLLQNAQESHGVAVPTPSVPEDFEEKAALGKGFSLLSEDMFSNALPLGSGDPVKEACMYHSLEQTVWS